MKKKILLTIEKVNQITKWIEIFLISLSVLIMVIDLVGGFLSRNLLNISWTFSEEVGSFTLIIITFVGIGYCARMGRHIRMSAVFDILPLKIKKWINYVICLVTALCLFYLTYLGLQWVVSTYVSAKVSPDLQIPMYLVYSCVPFGCFMGALQYLITFVKNILEPEEIFIGSEAKESDIQG